MARLRETRAGGAKASRKLGTHDLKKRNARILRRRARVTVSELVGSL
jgi:hypothetical protein